MHAKELPSLSSQLVKPVRGRGLSTSTQRMQRTRTTATDETEGRGTNDPAPYTSSPPAPARLHHLARELGLCLSLSCQRRAEVRHVAREPSRYCTYLLGSSAHESASLPAVKELRVSSTLPHCPICYGQPTCQGLRNL